MTKLTYRGKVFEIHRYIGTQDYGDTREITTSIERGNKQVRWIALIKQGDIDGKRMRKYIKLHPVETLTDIEAIQQYIRPIPGRSKAIKERNNFLRGLPVYLTGDKGASIREFREVVNMAIEREKDGDQ